MPIDHESQVIKLINWIFVAIGCICVLIAMLIRPYTEVTSDLLISIGSTLIATSLLAYLYQRMGAKTISDQLSMLLNLSEVARKSAEVGILDLWQERRKIPNNFWNDFTKESRKEVWLLGVAEYGFANDEAFHQILSDGTTKGCNYRILLLDSSSPSSKYWDDRDKSGLVPSKIRASTEIFQKIIKQNKGKSGRIELRVYDDVPSLSIVRADGEMIITLYISSLNGDGSPTIRIQQTTKGLFPKYEKQFEQIWNSAKIIEAT